MPVSYTHLETSEEDASAQAVKELKEDIEEGNVMVLSAAERATSSGSTVTLKMCIRDRYIMGHSNISITMNWYAHASIDTAKSEVQRLIA